MPRVGVTSLEIATLRFDLVEAYGLPEGELPAAVVPIPVLGFHLDLPGRSVLVDAPAYEEADTPEQYVLPGFVPPPPLRDQLRELGVEAESVTDVVITHAHFDHYAGLARDEAGTLRPAFPNARHWLGRADWPVRPAALARRTLVVVREAGLLTLVDGDLDLGDGLSLVAAPGESPGHQLVRAEAGGEVVYAVGDLYHHPLEFADPDLNVTWVDPVAMGASKRALMARAEREGARVLFSHIAGAHRVVRDARGPRFAPAGGG